MENQQAKILDSEIGWFAGFIDGEGTFCFLRREGRQKPKIDCHVPRFSVNNCHIATLEYVTSILDKVGIRYWVTWRNKNHPKHSEQWCVVIGGLKRIKPFLVWIIPYLFTKQKQAKLLLEFVNLRESKPYNAPYESKEFDLVYEVQTLNKPKIASTTTRRTSLLR